MATITNRGNLQWRARVRRKGHPTVSKTFEKKSDAEAWARQMESEMDRGIFVSRKEAESTTLHEALDRYILEYVPRLSNPPQIEQQARALQRRAIASKILATIRSKDMADYRREREAEGISGNTIRLEFALLSRLFNFARSDWGMESLQNPIELVTNPKLNPGRERRLEEGEEEKLLEAMTPIFRPIILFTLETGMRRGEIASLVWENVDLKNCTVFLPETKNGSARTVPLSPKAIAILQSIEGEKKGSVFKQTKSAITHAMIRACKKAHIEGLTFHDLRHEAISRLFENTDLDVMEVKVITGHKTLQMLARYTHLRASRLADRLAGARRNSKAHKE